MKQKYDSIFVIGATASGKTALAVKLALDFDGEIVSADSRQVYRRMDIGTGKDLEEYWVEGKKIPYHLIDICEPGEKYNVERFYQDASVAIQKIKDRGKIPIICGGSGLYIETLLRGNEFATIPKNENLRKELNEMDKSFLLDLFDKIDEPLKSKLDNSSMKKLIRSIEIADYSVVNGLPKQRDLGLSPLILGTAISRDVRRSKISKRLRQRLEFGMIQEVEKLLQEGITPTTLKYYGLEYLWLTKYCLGEINYEAMVQNLEVAIHQFAKRQMTWFRRMEKQGYHIHWIDPAKPIHEILDLDKVEFGV